MACFRVAPLAAWTLGLLIMDICVAPSVANSMSPLRRTNPAVFFRLGSGAVRSARPADTHDAPTGGGSTADTTPSME